MVEVLEEEFIKETDKEFINCCAFSGIVAEWIVNGMQGKPDEIVSKLNVTMRGVFPETVQRFLKNEQEVK